MRGNESYYFLRGPEMDPPELCCPPPEGGLLGLVLFEGDFCGGETVRPPLSPPFEGIGFLDGATCLCSGRAC